MEIKVPDGSRICPVRGREVISKVLDSLSPLAAAGAGPSGRGQGVGAAGRGRHRGGAGLHVAGQQQGLQIGPGRPGGSAGAGVRGLLAGFQRLKIGLQGSSLFLE